MSLGSSSAMLPTCWCLVGVAPAAVQTEDDCYQPVGTAGGLPLRTFAGHLAEGDGHLVGMQPGDLAVAGGRVLVGDTAGSVYFGDHDQAPSRRPRRGRQAHAGARPTSSSLAASPDGQLATEVALGEITAIAVSPSGLVHFADRRRIHRIEPDGRMTVLTEMDARALAFGPAGLYAAVTDEHRVHRIAHDGTVTLVAGNGARSPENPLIEGTYPGGGGPAAEAGLSGPNGVDVDAAGNVFIGDSGSQRVRHVDTTGRITTYLSGDTAVPLADGSETVRLGGGPLEVDPTGNLDLGRHRYDAAGYAELLLGGGNLPFPADGTPATRLRLDVPIPDTGLAGFAIDPTTGDQVIVDATNRRLRRVIGAAAPDRLTRFAGTNRIATAMVISQRSFAPGEARAVVLARADDFADALAGAPLAADKGGPLLLSPGFGVGLAEAEIRRVLPRGGTVYLLGGPAALHPDVEEELRQMGYQLVRYAGADRFDTAVRIASAGLGSPSTIFLANGSDFPDALTAGAAAVHRDGVVLLTQGSRMPGSTGRYLAANPGRHVALGGPAATAAPRAERIVGVDRYDTAAKVADAYFSTATLAGVASGRTFPDALAAGARAGRLGAPLLLTDPAMLPAPTKRWLQSRSGEVVAIHGGPVAISDDVRRQLQAS